MPLLLPSLVLATWSRPQKSATDLVVRWLVGVELDPGEGEVEAST